MKRLLLFLSLSLVCCEDLKTIEARRIGQCKVEHPNPVKIATTPDGTNLWVAYDCTLQKPIYFSAKETQYQEGKQTIRIPN